MKTIKQILAEKKNPIMTKRLGKEKEGRDELFFIGFRARDGFNIYCEMGTKSTFRSIEKMTSDQVDNLAFKATSDKAKAKFKEVQKNNPDQDDLELKSEFELAEFL